MVSRRLEQRRHAFFEPDPALDSPRGILLVGVQGGGKSLAVAGLWGMSIAHGQPAVSGAINSSGAESVAVRC